MTFLFYSLSHKFTSISNRMKVILSDRGSCCYRINIKASGAFRKETIFHDVVKQHVSRTTSQYRHAIEANEVELTVLGMRDEDDIVFCVFGTLNYSDIRQGIRGFAF